MTLSKSFSRQHMSILLLLCFLVLKLNFNFLELRPVHAFEIWIEFYLENKYSNKNFSKKV